MSNLNLDINNWLESNITETSNIYWGHLPMDLDYSEGAINFIRLPSSMDDSTTTTLAAYQFSIRHTDIYEAYKIKEELINKFSSWYGDMGDKKVVVWMDGEQGELWEDEDRLVHLPVIFNIKYIR